MKVALLGVGNAGTRIVDRLVKAETNAGREFTDGNVLALNTSTEAFKQTTAIPNERQILLGETHPAVTQRQRDSTDETDHETAESESQATTDTGLDASQFGVNADPDVGATVAKAELPEIRRALDLIDETEVAAAMVVAGLGGGTGCGVGSVLLEELQSIYECPVYVLGILPATTEPDQRARTAARGIRTVVPLADAVFPVDNEAWRHKTDQIADCYEPINDGIASRLISLFGVGEGASTTISEMRIDPADIRRTLKVGGLTSIGHATIDVEANSPSWLSRLWSLLGITDETDTGTMVDAATIKRLIRQALESQLTLPCDISSTDRTLLILSGPPETISRKGFETGRYLLEEKTETVEVLAGDELLSGATTITATVLFSNVTNVPRVKTLQQRAVSTQDTKQAAAQSTEIHGFQFQDSNEDNQGPDIEPESSQ